MSGDRARGRFVHKLQRALTPKFATSDWSPPAVD